MNRQVIAIVGTLCALSLYSSLAAESDTVLMRIIGPDLDVAFRAIEPCGDNYDSCMDTLSAALIDAKQSADDLMLPKIVSDKTRRLVEETFASFNDVVKHLRGKNHGTDRMWHRPADKNEMKGLYNTLEGYPKLFDNYLKKLQQTTKKSLLTTEKELTKNLAQSVKGASEFIDKILKKLDHYIHEPEEPQAPGQPVKE